MAVIAEIDHDVIAALIGGLALVLSAGIPFLYVSLGKKFQNGHEANADLISDLEKRISDLEEKL